MVVFGRQAEIAQQYLRKGSEAYIEGRLRTRKYTGKDGIERYSTEVVCESLQLGARPTGSAGSSDASDEFESPQRAPRAAAPIEAERPAAPALPRRLLRRRSPSSRLLRMLIPRSMGMTFRSESERDAFRIKNGRL